MTRNNLHLVAKFIAFIILFVSAWFVYKHWPSNSFTNVSEKLYKAETNSVKSSNLESESRNEDFDVSLSAVVDGDIRTKKLIPVIITFTKAKQNFNLQQTFRVTVDSILRFSSLPIHFHIIGDMDSQKIAEQTIREVAATHKAKFKLAHLDVDQMARDLHEIVKNMQEHFSSSGAYYSDALFYLSIAIHRVMPKEHHRVVMLDADLKFNADIRDLYKLFANFKTSNVIGIARENQPVYRHTFSLYRSKNPGTRVGDPPPNGLTGFNSGVLLLNLDSMRKSVLYNSLINVNTVKNLTQKFHFQGHLGDQDFFTLLSMQYEDLFYVLPCGWNRQLCRWWEDKGYQSVFHSYYDCQGYISIYHGNCNTPIPKLEWENS